MTGRDLYKPWVGKTPRSMPGPNVRDRISARQGDRCACCGRPFGAGCRANCDHIKPLRDGGENRESNLQMLCNWCHVEKTVAENTDRAKSRRIRAKRLGFDQVRTNRLRGRSFPPAAPQLSATTPHNKQIGQFEEDTAP